MKSFDRIKSIHGKTYLYRITPYYDRERKRIRQRSEYIGPVKDGNVVKRAAVTYSYGDLIPVMKAVRDLKLQDILGRILGEDATTVLIMAMNRVIRPEAMDLLEEWYDDSYISTIYPVSLSSSTLSRVMKTVGSMDANHLYLNEILRVTGRSGAMYYDLTSYSSQSRSMEFLEYGYSRSEYDLPQVNVSLVESSESGIPIFYDIYPGSVVDVTTVHNTVDILKSAGVKDVTLIMDRGMFSSPNIEYLPDSGVGFIMPASYSVKEVKRIALLSRRSIEKGGNMIRISGDIVFVQRQEIRIGKSLVNAWVYYAPGRDKMERVSFYSALHDRMDQLSRRKVRRWEKPREIAGEIMGPYLSFISWKHDGSFHVRVRDNAVSQRVNRCGITIITFTGDHDAQYVLSEYKKRDSVEKLFLSSKSFAGGEPLRDHGMETLRGEMFVNLITLAIRSRMLQDMRASGLLKNYSVEKMLLELHKLRKIKLQDRKEITTEITRQQKDILDAFSIKPEHVPNFLKS